MENNNNTRVHYWALLIFGVAATTMTAISYFALKNFIQDREELLSMGSEPLELSKQKNDLGHGREVKTYTAEELEDLRRQGKTPQGLPPQYNQTQAIQANEAAVQRSLKTLEEINRLNQMNQQLLEQQQRLNRQR